MSREILKIVDWLYANRLSFNMDKTKLVLFQLKTKHCEARLTLNIKEQNIFLLSKVNYLGVIFDSQLSWECHIAELAKNYNLPTIFYENFVCDR